MPGAGAEFSDEDEVLGDGGDEDDNAERDEGYSGEEREAGLVDGGGVGLQGGLGGLHLAKEETEASDGEAHAHETEAGADPGEEGALGGEEDARVAFGSVGGHVVTVAFRRWVLSVVRWVVGRSVKQIPFGNDKGQRTSAAKAAMGAVRVAARLKPCP